MIALCLAALLGALAGPLLAAAFASPVLILTAPLFASLAALLAGCGLAMASARVARQNAVFEPATASADPLAAIDASHNPASRSDDQTDAMVAALREILTRVGPPTRDDQAPSNRADDGRQEKAG